MEQKNIKGFGLIDKESFAHSLLEIKRSFMACKLAFG